MCILKISENILNEKKLKPKIKRERGEKMDKEKIARIQKLIDMIEVTDDNEKDIKKIRKLVEEGKLKEMLELLKKVSTGADTLKKAPIKREIVKTSSIEDMTAKEEEKKEVTEEDQIEELVAKMEEESQKEEDIIYPTQISNKKLEETYISLLVANPKAISMYYIEYKDCYFESRLMLNIYKSILFTEGEAYAPQVAKDNFNYAKESFEVFKKKKELLEIGRFSKADFEKVYVELRKLFEIRKGYSMNPIKETQQRIIDIVNYQLYDIMTIQEVKDAIEQINATEKFRRSVLSSGTTEFLLQGENDLTTGLSLPFPILSSVFKGIRKGETMSYSMPSNSGKSRFTINLAAYISYIHKKKVLIVSNEMSEEKMKLCLITTVINNPEIQKLHGHKLIKSEGEILEFKYKADKDSDVEVDEKGFVKRGENETLKDFSKRLLKCSTEFKQVIEITNWIEKQQGNQIFFVNITDHTNDELEKIILNYYYKEKIEYMFYDTLKTDTENIGNADELKKTATILSNLAQNLKIFIGSSLQLSENSTSPLNMDINDLAVCRTVKEVLDTLCLIKQIHNEDLWKYEYSHEEVGTDFFDLERSKDPDVRYYACVVDKNRAGAKPKVVFKLNLAYNEWIELGYVRLKSQDKLDRENSKTA